MIARPDVRQLPLVVALALALVLVPAALAAKGGGGSGGGGAGTTGFSLVVSTDQNGDGLPNFGDTITYNVSTSATSAPSVKTTCYQNSVAVLWTQAAFYAGNPFGYMDYLALHSGMWTSGAADCTAVMYYSSGKRTVTLSTLKFHVNA